MTTPAQRPLDVDALGGALESLRAEVEAGGLSLPGTPAAPRPGVLGGEGEAPDGAPPDSPVLGGPVPLVAVATTAGPEAEAMRQALVASVLGADLVEVRADLVQSQPDDTPLPLAASWASPALATASLLAAEGLDTPLLLTVRTSAEGGRADVDDAAYRRTLAETIRFLGEARATGRLRAVRAVDVEIERGCLEETAAAAHEAGLAVVASWHSFTTTPGEEEVLATLRRMQQQGADVAKLAAMPGPGGRADVVTLLRATVRARAALEVPVITMSMGEQGVPTRLLGGIFGSALTFATAGAGASAPGQQDLGVVRQALTWAAAQVRGG